MGSIGGLRDLKYFGFLLLLTEEAFVFGFGVRCSVEERPKTLASLSHLISSHLSLISSLSLSLSLSLYLERRFTVSKRGIFKQ